MKQERFSPHGFTLIELMVVVAIIGILAGMTVPDLTKSSGRFVLIGEAQRLAEEIRLVQEQAIASVEIEHADGDYVPEGGYGMYFKKASGGDIIQRFSDCDPNRILNPGGPKACRPPGASVGAGSFESNLAEAIVLNGRVQIADIKKDGASVSPIPETTVTFEPPIPKIFLHGKATAEQITIVLELVDDPAKTKNVVVNNRGLITIE